MRTTRGIARQHPEPCAAPLNLRVVSAPSRTELSVADEVFPVRHRREVTAIASIDHRQTGARGGPVTLAIADRFRSVARGGDPAYARG
jgi:branched-subunit amino acid aminotransferase/4-amino-4-deoxychorismate lyase